MILTNSRERTRFLRFAVVGIVGAVIDFGVSNFLKWQFLTPSQVAQAISFTMAVISNFILNRYWTYPDSRSKHVAAQVAQFVVISVIGLGIRTFMFPRMEPLMTGIFQPYASKLPFSPAVPGYNLTLAILIVIVMLWNFFANRYWTYADVE